MNLSQRRRAGVGALWSWWTKNGRVQDTRPFLEGKEV